MSEVTTKVTLEPIYLMNVLLYLPTYNEVTHFLLINKKCLESLERLKVNPQFINRFSYDWYLNHFTPECVCENLFLIQLKYLVKPKMIKEFGARIKDSTDPNYRLFQSLLPKVYSFRLFNTTISRQEIINNAKLFTHLKAIKGDLKYMIEFFNVYTDDGQDLNKPMPNLLSILDYNGMPLVLTESLLNNVKKLREFFVTDTVSIVLKFDTHTSNEKLLRKLLKIRGVHYFYMGLVKDQCKLLDENILAKNSSVDVNNIPDDYLCDLMQRALINRCYLMNDTNEHDITSTLTKEQIENLVENKEICKECMKLRVLPNSINKIQVRVNNWQETMGQLEFSINCKNIKDLEVISSTNFTCKQGMENIEYIRIVVCNNLIFDIATENVHLKKLRLVGCYNIMMRFGNNLSVDNAEFYDLNNVMIKCNEMKVNYIYTHECSDMFIPYFPVTPSTKLHFSNSTVEVGNMCIEDDEAHCTYQKECVIPHISYDNFKKLAKNCIYYPSKLDYEAILTKDYEIFSLFSSSNHLLLLLDY